MSLVSKVLLLVVARTHTQLSMRIGLQRLDRRKTHSLRDRSEDATDKCQAHVSDGRKGPLKRYVSMGASVSMGKVM